MSAFKITWTTGLTETVSQESATTVDEFVNVHFGSAWESAKDAGVTVDLVEDEETPVVKPAKAKKAAQNPAE